MAATGLKHNEKTIYKAMVKQLATEKNWKQQLEEYVARNGDFPFLDVLGVDKIFVQIGKRSGKIPIVVVVDNKSGRPVIYFIEESVDSANKELKRALNYLKEMAKTSPRVFVTDNEQTHLDIIREVSPSTEMHLIFFICS